MPLLPHQITGSAFLASRGFAYLADEPGAAKTHTAIHAADLVQAKTILVICPAVVRNNWAKEFGLWSTTTRKLNVVEGRPKAAPEPNTTTIISHDVLAHLPSIALLYQTLYDVIIVDEVHSFRNLTAARTLRLLDPEIGLFRATRYFWVLSGTPLVNSAADLWPLLCGPARMPTEYKTFCARYTHMEIGFDGWPVPKGVKNTDELAAMLRPHMICRTIESLRIPLPTLTIERVPVPIERDALLRMEGELRQHGWTETRLKHTLENDSPNTDEAIARVRRLLGEAKLAAVHEHILHNTPNQPLIVFFHHTLIRKTLYEQLHAQHRVTSWIDGKITRAQLVAAEYWFQQGGIDVLLVQTTAGGVGLTLHRSNHVVVAELPWTSVALHQAIRRIYRIGQTRPCTATILTATGCWLEDIMAQVCGRKQRAADDLLKLLITDN